MPQIYFDKETSDKFEELKKINPEFNASQFFRDALFNLNISITEIQDKIIRLTKMREDLDLKFTETMNTITREKDTLTNQINYFTKLKEEQMYKQRIQEEERERERIAKQDSIQKEESKKQYIFKNFLELTGFEMTEDVYQQFLLYGKGLIPFVNNFYPSKEM